MAEVLADFVHVERFIAEDGLRPGLVEEARAFHAAALAGRYYEDFIVNSRNHMSESKGTQAFIAEFRRLARLAIAASGRGEYAAAGQALDLLLDLHRQIDRFERDIIFFADEAGAWQIGVDWPTFLPAWFRCVAARTTPDAYAEITQAAIAEFVSDCDAARIRKAARAVADEVYGGEGDERSESRAARLIGTAPAAPTFWRRRVDDRPPRVPPRTNPELEAPWPTASCPPGRALPSSCSSPPSSDALPAASRPTTPVSPMPSGWCPTGAPNPRRMRRRCPTRMQRPIATWASTPT